MDKLPNCPKCNSEYTYEDGSLLVCPECAYEWTAGSEAAKIQKYIRFCLYSSIYYHRIK